MQFKSYKMTFQYKFCTNQPQDILAVLHVKCRENSECNNRYFSQWLVVLSLIQFKTVPFF